MKPEPNALRAAEWMAAQIDQHGVLYQYEAVDYIAKEFGGDLTYSNDSGNPAIGRKVLTAFRSLTEGTVVWERAEKSWRRKAKYDGKGRLSY